MNKKGFTVVEVLAVMIILGLLMLLVVPSINKLMKNNDENKYKTYERMMEEYAAVYPDKSLTIVKLSQLDNIAAEIEKKGKCIGYVEVDRTHNDYKAYIKCDIDENDKTKYKYITDKDLFDETKAG